MGRFRAVRRKLQAQSLGLRPWAIHPQAIWWTADSGVTRADYVSGKPWLGTSQGYSSSPPLFQETLVSEAHRTYAMTGTGTYAAGPFRVRAKLRPYPMSPRYAFLSETATRYGVVIDCVLGEMTDVGLTACLSKTITANDSGGWDVDLTVMSTNVTQWVASASTKIGASYNYLGDGSAFYCDSWDGYQHRISGWTSQIVGGAAGPAAAQATPASQLFVQADATSPNGIATFGKPCLWAPLDAAKTVSSADATLAGYFAHDKDVSVTALVSSLGAPTAAGQLLNASGTGSHAVGLTTDRKPYITAGTTLTAASAISSGTHVITWTRSSSGAARILVDGVEAASGTLTLGTITPTATIIGLRQLAARELVVVPSLMSDGIEAAMRAGMLQRLAA
jgi:hypothetical protein